eukprot:6484942-Amphidinium_carterae.1
MTFAACEMLFFLLEVHRQPCLSAALQLFTCSVDLIHAGGCKQITLRDQVLILFGRLKANYH